MVRSTGNTYNVSKEQNASGIGRRRFRPYPEYKDSGVEWLDQIPSHWNVKRLKFIASINDEVLAETTDPQYEMTYVDIGGVDQYQGIVDREKYVFETAPSRARRKVREGDVIISTVRTYLRAIAQIEAPESNLIVSTGFAVIRTSPIFSSRYAAYALRASYFIEKIVANSVGVSYPAIDASKMSSFSASFPELMEQEAIAAFLDHETAKIDALIEKKERLIELLQEKRTALITQAVTKGLDPTVPMKDSGVEWLGKIPAHWNVKRIKTVACLNTGGTPAGLLDEAFELEGVPWVKPDHLNGDHGIIMPDRRLSLSAAKAVGIIEAGSSLVCGIGTVGKTGHAPFIVCTNQQINAITFGCKVTNRFGQFIVSCLSQEFMRRANKVTLAICNKSEMGEVFICTPPLTEQRAVAAFLDRETAKIGTLLAKTHEAIDRLKEYRAALISAAVTGKIDVRDVGSKKRSDEN